MIKNFTTQIKKQFLLFASLFIAGKVVAQLPEAKVDLNMNGRPAAEVQEPGYTPWVFTGGLIDSVTVNSVKFIIKKGPRGDKISPTYWKDGVQSGEFSTRFTNDGIFVKDGDFALGSQIDIIIKGLPAGTHNFVTYHNVTDNLVAANVCPLDVWVDGALVIDNLIPSVRKKKATECATAELQITAQDGKEVLISIIAETTGAQASKNVFLNGFQLNGVNLGNKSRSPFPQHRDGHIDAPNGSSHLIKWSSSPGALSHNIYVGTDSLAVATADINSPFFKGNQAKTDTSYNVINLYSMNTYYWRVDEVTESTTYKGDIWWFRTRQLAFPDAEGYGRFARGGRGGKVVEVTNLNDSGPGSLREAVTNNIGPRTIVFAVSGIIQLRSRLVLSQPYVTVAGQTAPGKGICIRSAPFGITGNDCIVRHMRVRLGGGPTYDGMGLTGADHSIMDHCSISWTIDEGFSSRGAKNITLQRTLISEALNVAGHQNYPEGSAHGYAATIGGARGSFHHNLLAHCAGRNWSLGGGLSANGYYTGELDITNNVVYNWENRATDGGAKEVNFVNNYYKMGPSTKLKVAFNAQHEGVGLGMQRCYFNGNVMPGVFDEGTQSLGRKVSYSNGDNSSYETYVDAPFFPSYVTTQTAYHAYKNVMSDIGCAQPLLDDHDIRIVNETLEGTYTYVGSRSGKKGLIDNEADAGGYENYPEVVRPEDWDTDHDGMPNWWEKLKGFEPDSPAGDFSESNGDPDGDGITHLEEYLEWMANPHYSAIGPMQSISVDLKDLSRGYTVSPSFSTSNVKNGFVNINNGVAEFTPSGAGFGSFNFTVTDGEGASMTRRVNLVNGADVTLPVTLTNFDAVRKDPRNVRLSWHTSQELNNDYFQVERSFGDASHFAKTGEKIASKAENGTSTSPLNYAVNDQNNYSGDTYYRLVQKDKDGKTSSSELRIVKGMLEAGLSVWPVPNKGDFYASVANVTGNCSIHVYDVVGRLIESQAVNNGSTNALHVNVAGVYVVKVVSNADNAVLFTRKVVVH